MREPPKLAAALLRPVAIGSDHAGSRRGRVSPVCSSRDEAFQILPHTLIRFALGATVIGVGDSPSCSRNQFPNGNSHSNNFAIGLGSNQRGHPKPSGRCERKQLLGANNQPRLRRRCGAEPFRVHLFGTSRHNAEGEGRNGDGNEDVQKIHPLHFKTIVNHSRTSGLHLSQRAK
jgi:hypothetical protein